MKFYFRKIFYSAVVSVADKKTGRHRGWTIEQKNTLKQLVDAQGIRKDWKSIGKVLNKPRSICYGFYHYHYCGGKEKVNFSRKPWSIEEDKILTEISSIFYQNGSLQVSEYLKTVSSEKGIENLCLDSFENPFELTGKILGRSQIECSYRFKSISDCSSIPRRYPGCRWTDSENARLLNAFENHPNDWDLIAMKVGTRTASACKSRWFVKINPMTRSSYFTPEECSLLQDLVEKNGKCWTMFEKYFPGRSRLSISLQYKKLRASSETQPRSYRKGYKNILWSKDDLLKLEQIVISKEAGKGLWNSVSQHFPMRSPTSCRLAYKRFLFRNISEPAPKRRKIKWTPEEHEKLRSLVLATDHSKYKAEDFWKFISSHFEHRSPSSCMIKYRRELM